MYKVFIVDDEPWSIIGIQKIFRWAEYGFEVAGTACDAYEALGLLESVKPDVVFTDIRMPEMSGLELIEAIRGRGLRCEFVAVSGFAEFQYAQQAIRLNVLDYIIKPISAQNADTLLERLGARLKKKSAEEGFLAMEGLMNGSEGFRALCRACNVGFLGDFYAAAVCDGRFSENCVNPGSIVFCFGTHKGVPMYMVFTKAAPRAFVSGIARCTEGGNVKKKIKTAVAGMYTAVFMGCGCYDAATRNAERLDALLTVLTGLHGEGNRAKTDGFIRSLPELFIREHFNLNDAVMLLNHALLLCGEKSELFDTDTVAEEFTDFGGACVFMRELLCGADKDFPVNESMARLIEHVGAHFTEPLSLSGLSEKFYINFTYASSLFKKATGQSFSQYVTELRMKKARALLKDPSINVSRVSELCGFEDCYYFNKVFKKYYGISPSLYRL